jgi:hypothetical protein
MIDTPEPESLPPHPLLARSAPVEDDRLRQAVFVRTARVLRRRCVVRRLAHAVALAACFLGGMLTAEWRRPLPPPPEKEIVTVVPPTTPAPPAAEPAELERLAKRNPERRGDLYRQAGDLYATEQGDLSSALRCYRESLDAGNEKDLTISTDDHWLLMAIKDARQKEKNDARTSH